MSEQSTKRGQRVRAMFSSPEFRRAFLEYLFEDGMHPYASVVDATNMAQVNFHNGRMAFVGELLEVLHTELPELYIQFERERLEYVRGTELARRDQSARRLHH
jgi:hypothetical protein